MSKKNEQFRQHARSQLDLILYRLRQCNYPGRWVNTSDMNFWVTRAGTYLEVVRMFSKAKWIISMQRDIWVAWRDAADRIAAHEAEMAEYEAPIFD
jgi:hypothetical protein